MTKPTGRPKGRPPKGGWPTEPKKAGRKTAPAEPAPPAPADLESTVMAVRARTADHGRELDEVKQRLAALEEQKNAPPPPPAPAPEPTAPELVPEPVAPPPPPDPPGFWRRVALWFVT